MNLKTSDLCDKHDPKVRVADPLFKSYGARTGFSGQVVTVKVFEDNSLVREALSQDGGGKVLVVDGGGSLRCALVGDQIARLAHDNGWSGIVVYGCIRDSADIAGIDVGIRALNTHPRKSVKKGAGDRNIPVTFAGVTFTPDNFVCADEDGILVSDQPLD